MKTFQRGQFWLVNFEPSIGHEYKKVRPALIIQQNRYISTTKLLTVIPVSSQTVKQTELDVLVKSDTHNRLMKDSLLKTKQISSFDKRRFIKYIGILDEHTIHFLDEQIQQFLFGKVFREPEISEESTDEIGHST